MGESTRPSHRQNCTITECPQWHINSWSKCSGKCGVAERHRRIWCSHNGRELEDTYCLQSKTEKPSTTEICPKDVYCPDWAIGMWSDVCYILFDSI